MNDTKVDNIQLFTYSWTKFISWGFQGRKFKDIQQKAQQGINLPDGGQYIYVFGLKGEPLRKYVLDHYIHGISVNEQKGVIIATDVNKDEPIIEYHMNGM